MENFHFQGDMGISSKIAKKLALVLENTARYTKARIKLADDTAKT